MVGMTPTPLISETHPARPHARLYRPGDPFGAEELQGLTAQGALRHLLGDVYIPRTLPLGPEVRAQAVSTLLSPADRTNVVICGELAGWIHIGAPAPRRLTLICSGFRRRRRRDVLDRQSHDVHLEETDICTLGPLQVTTPARTAADTFLGIGTTISTGPLHPGHDDQRRVELVGTVMSVFADEAAPKRVEDVIALQRERRGATVDRAAIAEVLQACIQQCD